VIKGVACSRMNRGEHLKLCIYKAHNVRGAAMAERIDPGHPLRARLISEFVDKREQAQRDPAPETQRKVEQIDKALQILADQVKPN
jgi:hypothetical protein